MHCPHCNKKLNEIPLCYGSDAPIYYYQVNVKERKSRFDLTKDQCVMDNEYFFIRGHIEIPIIGSEDKFIWSVWVSLSEQNFIRSNELWNVHGRENEDPYFGWLSTELNIYPSTINLKTHVHTRAIGLCPVIELEPNDHPLAVEQRNGVTMDRITEIAHLINHKN